MKQKEHLPLYGVGPVIVGVQALITAIGCTVSAMGYIDFGKISFLDIPLTIIGIILIVFGVYLEYSAKKKSKLFEHVAENKLITTGIYSIVRNPVYSAAFLICTGVICIANNLLLFVIPLICWIYMTVFLINTEEKWLKDLYGQEYVDYCKRVNRCIPWFPKKD